jgi:hypothetical protein
MALPDEGATGAPTVDNWGRDPQVRMMRRVFALMEVLQARLLGMAGISPFDERLGHWRRAALGMFEREWVEVSRRGGQQSEEDLARVYGDCLFKVLAKDGVSLPENALSAVQI